MQSMYHWPREVAGLIPPGNILEAACQGSKPDLPLTFRAQDNTWVMFVYPANVSFEMS